MFLKQSAKSGEPAGDHNCHFLPHNSWNEVSFSNCAVEVQEHLVYKLSLWF